jgi:two-component system NtrC family sensor kinase
MRSLAEAACELPWLAPCAGSLVALTRPSSSRLWPALRGDPGLVLLLLRQAPPAAVSSACSFYPSLLHEPGVLQRALECLETDESAFVDWNHPALVPIYRAAMCYATAAEAVALISDRCDPEHAWVGGLLAPLGWLAAASDAAPVRRCLAALVDPAAGLQTSAPEPLLKRQQEWWGLDPSAIARRLALRWRLPAWLTAAVGHLGMPLEVARTLGADPDHFQVVQLAVTLVEQTGQGLRLPVGTGQQELADRLHVPADELQKIAERLATDLPHIAPPRDWKAPHRVPLLADLLRLAVENRKLTGESAQERLHVELDALHEVTRRQHASEVQRLHERKLSALAELAAGAGHEINNPLAVISGQAQYLLLSEQEPSRRKALQTIVSQSQRIHTTLTQLMQFARPSTPYKQRVDLGGLLHEVVGALQPLADDRQVRVIWTEPKETLTLLVDPGQIRAALAALLRNAIEAAPASGWASLCVDARVGVGLTILVEDNGPGPALHDREHLFDPFYSGRKAGRGRGLGLPTAWRIARQHGGEVIFDCDCSTGARFILTLPAEAIAEPLPPASESNGLNGCHRPVNAESAGPAAVI